MLRKLLRFRLPLAASKWCNADNFYATYLKSHSGIQCGIVEGVSGLSSIPSLLGSIGLISIPSLLGSIEAQRQLKSSRWITAIPRKSSPRTFETVSGSPLDSSMKRTSHRASTGAQSVAFSSGLTREWPSREDPSRLMCQPLKGHSCCSSSDSRKRSYEAVLIVT
jgi:hypothetical protein